jgi:hypothetical protein
MRLGIDPDNPEANVVVIGLVGAIINIQIVLFHLGTRFDNVELSDNNNAGAIRPALQRDDDEKASRFRS